jgi:tRNA (mo5U34)-methyltransferase
LKGLECLEIGSGNGFWAFEMERRGGQVTTLDLPDFFHTDFSIRAGHEGERPAGLALPGAFGEPLRIAAVLRDSRIRYRLGSVYDVMPETHGTFDVVFCGSMLMHLFGPMLALQRMASVCRDTLLLTTQTEPALEPLNALAYLGHDIPYVHFVPSPTCLGAMLSSCGFERVLRGPTFLLRYGDANNTATIPHTAFVALKRRSASPTGLLRAGTGASGDSARLAVSSVPTYVEPGRELRVTIAVRNQGSSDWVSPDEADALTLRVQGDWGGAATATVADYLPAGLESLATATLPAPSKPGTAGLRITLMRGRRALDATTIDVSVPVRPGGFIDSVADRARNIVSRF